MSKWVSAKSLSWVRLTATPMDYTLADSSVHGSLQARILKWVAMPFSRDLPDLGSPHISGRFFTVWATQKAPSVVSCMQLLLFTRIPPTIQWWDELQITGTDTPVQKEEKIGGTEELEFHNSPKNPSRHVLEVPWLGLNPTSAWEWFSMAFDFIPLGLLILRSELSFLFEKKLVSATV